MKRRRLPGAMGTKVYRAKTDEGQGADEDAAATRHRQRITSELTRQFHTFTIGILAQIITFTPMKTGTHGTARCGILWPRTMTKNYHSCNGISRCKQPIEAVIAAIKTCNLTSFASRMYLSFRNKNTDQVADS